MTMNEFDLLEETYEFPLSPAQHRLWVLSQFESASTAYHISGCLELTGALDIPALERAIALLTERHESLRTTFEQIEGEVLQVVHPQGAIALPQTDLSAEQDPKERLQAIAHATAKAPFDLAKGPICRLHLVKLEETRHQLFASMHHIISDGWSMGIFIDELAHCYSASLLGQDISLPPLDIQYSDYALWQLELEEEGSFAPALADWVADLSDAPQLLELPTDKQRPAHQRYRGSSMTLPLGTALSKQIRETARRCQTTPFSLLFSAYGLMLGKYSGQQDLLIGSPAANRGQKELERVIGIFMNVLPLRMQWKQDLSFASLLAQVQQSSAAALGRQEVSFEKILDALNPARSAAYHPLFQVMFSLDSFIADQQGWHGLQTRMLPIDEETAKFDLSLMVKEEAESFSASWEYSTALFEQDTVTQMARYFEELLKAIVANPQDSVSRLSAKAAEALLPAQWQEGRKLSLPETAVFSRLFEDTAAANAAGEALVVKGERLDYATLNAQANQMAHYLRSEGLSSGDRLGIMMQREAALITTVLACLKAGLAYVPLDPAYPAERLSYISQHAGLGLILSDAASAAAFEAGEETRILPIEDISAALAQEPRSNLDETPAADAAAYLIYTSGSTGQPKGVVVPQVALCNFLLSMQEEPGMHAEDRLLAVTTLSFDIAGLEWYLPLLTGGTLVLAAADEQHSAQALMHLLEEEKISIMQATPATWKLLLDSGWKGKQDLKALCGGEALPASLAERLLPATGSLWNMYGPTETTIWSATAPVKQSDRAQVSIGKPIANTGIYLLDAQGLPVPPGAPGHLYIGGMGLASGYFADEEQTAARFTDHPVHGRIYQTGDLGRWLPDGSLDFAGRADTQVKVNGYRIELGEVEHALAAFPAIKEAAAAVVKDKEGLGTLVAYLVAEEEVSREDLRSFLSKRLPRYMVPGVFMMLEALPLTPNRKIDRKRLPAPEQGATQGRPEYVAPETAEEKVLAAIWEEVLSVEQVGLDDNFFDLGGASLQSIHLAGKAGEQGIYLDPETVFEFPVLRELSAKAASMRGLHNGVKQNSTEELQIEEGLFEQQGPTIAEADIRIESMACYLPEVEVSSQEVVAGCANPLRFPMERLTGIKSRHRVSEGEYAYDLAVRAMEHCFAMSECSPQSVDILIACNVFRMDDDRTLSLEPSTATRLADQFGMGQAERFDLSNACAGIFTGLILAESYIKTGRAARVMLVSGEYLTHLTDTAQQKIVDYMDRSISALTVGDSGLAMILEPAKSKEQGLRYIDMFTMGGYSDLCVVKATREKQGGLILHTDALKMAEAGHTEAGKHALKTMARSQWQPDEVDYLLMHQASSTTTANTAREVNRLFGEGFASKERTIDNIRHRGNTATTTHWMAIQDRSRSKQFLPGQNLMMLISGSGLNLGTGLYTFDELPARIHAYWEEGKTVETTTLSPTKINQRRQGRARITAFDYRPAQPGQTSLDWLCASSREVMDSAGIADPNEIAAVIYAGVHRDEYVFEPAIATFLSGELNINARVGELADEQRSLVFDVFNGSIGFLQALQQAEALLSAKRGSKALVSTAEIDESKQLGIEEGAASLLLEYSTEVDAEGFGRFVFAQVPALAEDIRSEVKLLGEEQILSREVMEGREALLLQPLASLARYLLDAEGCEADTISHLVAPISDARLFDTLRDLTGLKDTTELIGLPAGMGDSKEALSLQVPGQLHTLIQNKEAGQRWLILSSAAGGQIGASCYYL